MERPNNDTNNIAGPSIALLQERFRQLEKAREQREDKTLKLFPEPQVMNISTKNCIPAQNQELQHDEMVIFPSEKDHLSLGLSLNNSNQTGFRAMKTRTFWSGFSANRIFENSDVDTSLHL
ncbi:hypothetical protein A4A49_64897 [Nicotiana attenuata]|uniref:Uncharacterized protein n=1 Tax=Nicotiana attenuata TaxID=49451 RepID=A0A1J6KMT4_NICAT|nr:hypothetical protein A4A49_29269 [Nicotiana attenuata]OIT29952.1 hypothetical protein A4A49_64897 [Nicotiana attenuata]